MDELKKFGSWSEVIKNYIDNLDDISKKDEYLDTLIATEYKKTLLSVDDINNAQFKKDILKIKAIKPTHENKLELEKYYNLYAESLTISKSLVKINKLSSKTSFYNIWICRAIKEGEGIYPATHVAKLTHSKSTAASILDKRINSDDNWLTTSSLNELVIDGVYPNAASSKVAKFLLLNHSNNLLSEAILAGDKNVFSQFSENEDELDCWFLEMKSFLTPEPNGDFLKQIYFPANNDYHLLATLNSSTMIQKIFQKYYERSIRNERDKLNKIISKGKYSPAESQRIFEGAKIFTVLNQPQNVSVLSGSRSGAIRLFSSQPPTWEKQLKPPIYKKSLFDNLSHYQINEDLKYLIEFLQRFKYLDLSYKDPKRYAHLERWVESIVDEVLYYANSIQKLPASWSADDAIKLKIEHQYFLDPYRDDDVFQASRSTTDWQTVVRDDFASWINRKLVLKDKKFTPLAEHTQLWKKPFKDLLREDTESIKAEKQYHKKEVAQ